MTDPNSVPPSKVSSPVFTSMSVTLRICTWLSTNGSQVGSKRFVDAHRRARASAAAPPESHSRQGEPTNRQHPERSGAWRTPCPSPAPRRPPSGPCPDCVRKRERGADGRKGGLAAACALGRFLVVCRHAYEMLLAVPPCLSNPCSTSGWRCSAAWSGLQIAAPGNCRALAHCSRNWVPDWFG